MTTETWRQMNFDQWADEVMRMAGERSPEWMGDGRIQTLHALPRERLRGAFFAGMPPGEIVRMCLGCRHAAEFRLTMDHLNMEREYRLAGGGHGGGPRRLRPDLIVEIEIVCEPDIPRRVETAMEFVNRRFRNLF